VSTAWTEALEIIKSRVTPVNYETYFRPLHLASLTENHIRLAVPDAFFADWIREHYFDMLVKVMRTATGQAYTVEIVVEDIEEPTPTQVVQPRHVEPEPAVPEFPLNPYYTFENFVVGSANQMAHAASTAVAEQPSQVFNPLFIYGGTGLGKTHLMHAIAHRIRARNPSARLLYLSAEEFMNQVITSIKEKKMDALRARYRRSCDVLLMDDVHILAGKEATQEEFFHTFNALHTAQKQIVLTSDRPPQEMGRLEDRLRSRFQWGLLTDVHPPQFETRVAILKAKAERDGIGLPNDVAQFLAQRIEANVRELEGALIRLSAFASFRRQPLTIEFASDILKGLFEHCQKPASVEKIIQIVADHFQVDAQELIGKRRYRAIAHPRSVAMYLCRKHVQASYPQLGKDFGGKDHSTVLSACRKIKNAIPDNAQLNSDIQTLERRISAR